MCFSSFEAGQILSSPTQKRRCEGWTRQFVTSYERVKKAESSRMRTGLLQRYARSARVAALRH